MTTDVSAMGVPSESSSTRLDSVAPSWARAAAGIRRETISERIDDIRKKPLLTEGVPLPY